jgi:hypothetical protein
MSFSGKQGQPAGTTLDQGGSLMEQEHLFKDEGATERERQAAQKEEPEFAAFAALNGAGQKHYWSLRAACSKQIERGEVENTLEAVEVWAAQWGMRFESRPLAVALERRRGALVAMLSNISSCTCIRCIP